MTITTVGIDLAKNVFAVHCVDQNGKTVLVKPKVSRAALPELIASLPPCVIGMEACSGAHYWARVFRQYGHEPRLMAAKFVSPYCKYPSFSSTHFLRFPGFQPSAGILPVSGYSGIHGAAHCYIHSASVPLFPVLHSVF